MAGCREHTLSQRYVMADAVAVTAAREDALDRPIKQLVLSIIVQAIKDARGHDAAASDAKDFLLRRIWYSTDCICELARYYVPFRIRKAMGKRIMV